MSRSKTLSLSLSLLAALGLCGLAAPAAHAQDAETNANRKMAEKRKKKVIAYFFSKLEQRDLPPDLKGKLMKLREGAMLGGEYGCIHQALLLLYPDYARASAHLLDERFAAAADAFEKLMDSEDFYLRAYATFRRGLAQMNRERFEAAKKLFNTVLNEYGNKVGCDIEAAFYRVVCLGQEREKEQAITAAKTFLKDYPDAAERYRKAMEQILAELVQEWESPLYDLAGRMSKAGRRIESGNTGKDTQTQQEEIVSIIDELIKKAKQNEGQGQGQGGGSGPPRGNDPSSNPANQSNAPAGASKVGDLRPRPKRKPGEQWGKMRDKEREEVLQALKNKFPDRYRELLEQYNKTLAEGERVTESTDD